MRPPEGPVQDVMQVCRNGHVITDRLRASPEQGLAHCDRCGAVTLDRCRTCGQELPGAVVVPGLQPLGAIRPPLYCSGCGAAFPWADPPGATPAEPLAWLEGVLRRLPRAVRQLRTRHGDRPPFRVADEKDLEDLLRALLPLHFDGVRPQCRTPRYSAGTRTDFLLPAERVVVTVKVARPDLREAGLAGQFQEDAEYYRKETSCDMLVGYVHDPEGLLREPRMLTGNCGDEIAVRCVVGDQYIS